MGSLALTGQHRIRTFPAQGIAPRKAEHQWELKRLHSLAPDEWRFFRWRCRPPPPMAENRQHWIRIFPDQYITKRVIRSPMISGNGAYTLLVVTFLVVLYELCQQLVVCLWCVRCVECGVCQVCVGCVLVQHF